jgi:hypothetical protein
VLNSTNTSINSTRNLWQDTVEELNEGIGERTPELARTVNVTRFIFPEATAEVLERARVTRQDASQNLTTIVRDAIDDFIPNASGINIAPDSYMTQTASTVEQLMEIYDDFLDLFSELKALEKPILMVNGRMSSFFC